MIKIPSQISKVTTMADRSLRLHVDTQELSPQDKAELMELYDYPGVFVFAKTDIQEEDLVDLPEAPKKDRKTQSQRLRGVIFRMWEQRNTSDTFDRFYDDYMERIIEKIKDKLE